MCQEANKDKNIQNKIQSLDELKAWLISKGVDISPWGTGATKKVESLWDEIVNGEIYLQDDPPLRITPVVQIIIRKGENILMESEQEFIDNRRRFRNHPPSEKIRQGEDYIDAVMRCLNEELQLEYHNIEILDSTYRQIQQENDSPSYPGLPTQYNIHRVEAKVDGLPSGENFWTIEAVQGREDPVKKHYWVWRKQVDEII
jgi:NUDIX domain